jgi:hypothetical protein
MKAINFQEMSFKRNWPWVILMTLPGIFIILSIFDVWDFMGEKTVKLITVVCWLLIVIKNLKLYFSPNSVKWGKRGITIRINSFLGISFNYDDVKDIVYSEDAYTVYLRSRNPKTINLEGVEQDSKEKLLRILREYIPSPARQTT